MLFECFNKSKAIASWESLKLRIQERSQQIMRFQQKQARIELQSLHSSLKHVNRCIYMGDSMDSDRHILELRITQILERQFFDRKDNRELDWILKEGKMSPGFLHLEDTKMIGFLESLSINGKDTSDVGVVLSEINKFYTELYSNHDTCSDEDIQDFLDTIPSLPEVLLNTDEMTGDITVSEVENAIKQLHLGKSPGFDGLTAAFYKHFVEKDSLILASVFNQAFKDKALSMSQYLAIIILLHKRRAQNILTITNLFP